MSRDDRSFPDGIQPPSIPSVTHSLPAPTTLLPRQPLHLSDHDLRSDPYQVPYPLDYHPLIPHVSAVTPAPAPPLRPTHPMATGLPTPHPLVPSLPFQQPQSTPHLPQLPSAHFIRDRSDYPQHSISPPIPHPSPIPPPPQPPPPPPPPPPPAPAHHHYPVDSPSQNTHTFSGLTNGVIGHPLFALIFKKVFEVCGNSSFDTGQLAAHFEDSEASAKALQHYANDNGLDRACERWTSTDVFMSALISAFNSLPTTRSLQHSTNTPSSSSTPLSNQSPTLQHTIFTAEKILNSSNVWQQADPRAVGSTSLHNDRLLLSNVPSHSRASGVWRNDRLIHKNPHGNTTRTPLSEKAKAALERWFTQHLENPYPDVAQKLELARECSMTLSSVNNWFGNKRMRIKRKMLNVNNSEAYPGSETRSISDKVLAPRSKWNAVVVSKMNSQAGREVVASATGRANVYSDEHDVVASGVITTSEQPRSMPLHDQRIHPSAPPSHGLENLQ